MDRKEFLQKLGLVSGCLLLAPRGAVCGGKCGDAGPGAAQELPAEFVQNWIKSLLSAMEEHLGAEAITAVLETCGRDCFRRGPALQMAEANKGKLETLVNNFAAAVGKDNCYLEDGKVHMKLSKCSCQLASKIEGTLPKSFCICSQGFIKEMFSIVAEKPVLVSTPQTIKRGDPCCEFVVEV